MSSDSLMQSIHRDAMATLRALTATIRGLMMRGDSLESLSHKSEELLISAIVFEERAERAHQQVLAENRARLSMSRVMLMRCCLCLLVGATLTFLVYAGRRDPVVGR
jgi:Synaptobrevin